MYYIASASRVDERDFRAFRDAKVISITWKSQDQRDGLYYPVLDIVTFMAGRNRLIVWTDNGRIRPTGWLLEILQLPYIWKGVANPASFVSAFRNYLKRHFKYVPNRRTLQWDFWLFSFLGREQSREQYADEIGLVSPRSYADAEWDWRRQVRSNEQDKVSCLTTLVELDYELTLYSHQCWYESPVEEEEEGEMMGPPPDPEDERQEEVRQYQQGVDYEDIHSD